MSPKLDPTRYPGVFRRGNRYVVRYRDGQGVQRQQGGFLRAKDADTWKKDRDRDISDGVWLGEGRKPFDAYAREWVEAYHGRGRRGFRESTRHDYRRALELYAIPYFSARLGRTLSQITPYDINQFVGWLCNPEAQAKHHVKQGIAKKPTPVLLSDSRISNIVAPVRSCLATAVEDGLIRSNPADRVRLPNREHRSQEGEDEGLDEEIKALTPTQLRKWLAVIEQQDRRRRRGQAYALAFEFLAATGLRWSEFAPLTWRYVDLNELRVRVRWQVYRGRRVRPKSKYGRRDVPLPARLAVKLRRHKLASGRTGDDDLVFATIAGTQIDHSNFMRDVVMPAGKKAGLGWVTPHTFRHTCASMLFAQGRNAVQVQRWLGHHSAAFTLSRYVHLLSDDLGAALEIAGPAEQLRIHELGQ